MCNCIGDRGNTGPDCVKGLPGVRGVPGQRGLPGEYYYFYRLKKISIKI